MDTGPGRAARGVDRDRAADRLVQLQPALLGRRRARPDAEGDGRLSRAAARVRRPGRPWLRRQPRGRGLARAWRRSRPQLSSCGRRDRPVPRDHGRLRVGPWFPGISARRRSASRSRYRAATRCRVPLRIHLLRRRRAHRHRRGARFAAARIRCRVLRADRRRVALLSGPDRRRACAHVPAAIAALVPLPRSGADGRDVAADASLCLALPWRGRHPGLQPAERVDCMVGGAPDRRAVHRVSESAEPARVSAQHRPRDGLGGERRLPTTRGDRVARNQIRCLGGSALGPGSGPAACER